VTQVAAAAGTAVAPVDASPEEVGADREMTPPSTLLRWWWLVPVGIGHALLAAPAVWNGYFHPERWTGPVDYPAHLGAAREVFPRWWEPALPHFGIHGASRLLDAAVPWLDLGQSMFLVTLATLAAFGMLLAWMFARALPGVTRWVPAGLSFAFAFAESPSGLLGWSFQNPPDFYLSLTNPNSQTHLGSHVFGLALLLLVSEVLEHPDSKRAVRWLLPLALVTTIVKPNLSPVLALVAFVWAVRRRHEPSGPRRLSVVWWRLTLPIGLLSLYQAWIVEAQSPRLIAEADDRGLALAPFRDLAKIGGLHPVFWGLALFPLVAFVVFGRELLDPLVELALACLGVLLVLALVFGIDGEMYGADFWWTAHIGFLVVCIAVAARICALWSEDHRRWRQATLVAGAVWAVYVVAGAMVWSCEGTGVCLVG